ncbi:MAG: cyclic nucleotide-binding domain-containing protein [Polyangiaceae bacterium]|nr:cyclic nucleotide-binding domain-containing protein [Polyangiaceae bacterium]
MRAGDVLFREGDDAEHVLFMIDGRLRLSREGRHDWVYEGRWVIGSIDVLVGRRRRRTATAETNTRLTRMSAARWFEAIRDRPDVLLDTLSDFARGCCELYAKLAPDAGFAQPTPAAPPLDASSLSGRARALASLPLLRGVGAQVIFEVAALAKTHSLAPDEALFEAGTSPQRAFVVTRGLVEARRRDPDASATFAAGSLVGGALFLGDVTSAWTARALGPAEVLSFSIDDLFDHLEEHHDSLRAVLGTFSFEQERLREELSEREGELLLR